MGAWPRLPPDALEPDPAYRAVLDWVWSFSARARGPDELAHQRATKLERMRALLAALGNPERAYPSLLVAGSKGKGSVVAMLAAALQAAGRRTARYTGPHLVNWRERACVDGQPISTEEVIALAEPVRAAVQALPAELGAPTTFEVGTAFAFTHFLRARVDVAVVEVGVGGLLDATNVLEPLVSVIAPVSLDHTATLGPTLTAIARHKAGILRAGRPGVIAPQAPEALAVIESTAAAIGAPLVQVGRDWRWRAAGSERERTVIEARDCSLSARLALLGDHQRDNATAVVAALDALGRVRPELAVPPAAVRAGLERVTWPGRLQQVRAAPRVVLDGAHNRASAGVLRAAVERCFDYRRLLLVLGITSGKDAQGMLEMLLPMRPARVYLTRSQHERAAEPEELARLMGPGVDARVVPEVHQALAAAVAEAAPDDLVLVTGSLFVVGEALVWARA